MIMEKCKPTPRLAPLPGTTTPQPVCHDGINDPPISDRDRVLALIRAEAKALESLAGIEQDRRQYITATDLRVRADQCDVLFAKIDALLMLF
jgi:hypothetical protein